MKKKDKSDLINARKSKGIERKLNPFELQIRKDKFKVLNRKTQQNVGQPTAARQKSFDKRKETIGREFKTKSKSNAFIDKRRKNDGQGFRQKTSIYNLNESEVLTHHGQTLAEVENYDDMIPDDNISDDDEDYRLDANFTKNAHFGGGESLAENRDRKTVIEELIADSKKRKAEKMKEHEEIMDLTQQLDNDWKGLSAVINSMQRVETPEKPEMDEYDRLVKEMIFLPRGGEPTEKLLNEEDLAQIEKDKLRNLEQERLQRLKGDDEVAEEKQSQFRSADDLDDGYFLEPDIGDDDGERVISYPINDDNGSEAEQEEDGGEEEEEEEKEPGNADESKNESANEDSENEGDEGSESEEEDDLEDLKADSEESDEEQTAVEDKPETAQKSKNVDDSLPFIINFPVSYESLMELLDSRTIKTQSIVIERIIKTNHPKLFHMNKPKMLKLFAYLLQYINDQFGSANVSNISSHFKLLRHLIPHLYDLAQMNAEECSKCFLEVIKEKYEEFKKCPKVYPKLDTLIFFRLVDCLFPTSDFRHPVVTPSFVFLHHILSQAKIKSRSDVSSGLFLATLVLDQQQISKRFLPAVMNFLRGVCYLGVKKSLNDNLQAIPPFKKQSELLVPTEKIESNINVPDKLDAKDFLITTLDDAFKLRAINLASNLMKDFVNIYSDTIGVKYLIIPYEITLKRLLKDASMPPKLMENLKDILTNFQQIRAEKKFKYLEPIKKVTPMLKMLEPRFEMVSTDRRSMYCQATGNAAEKKKLQHVYKREFKAAKRELRRDNEFISKIRQKRRHNLDIERKEKVKRIFDEASTQQQEFKALSRTKGRKGLF